MKLLQVKPKNPATVYAIQYTGKNLEELQEWIKNFEPNFTEVEINDAPDAESPDLLFTDIDGDTFDIFVCDWLMVELNHEGDINWRVLPDYTFKRFWEGVNAPISGH